jgi:hypothetical protein
MKLVILGAGASFDSIYEYYDGIDVMPWRPPLANELFSPRKNFREIILKYPGGRYFMSQLNGINDVEDFFEKQWKIIENNRADDLMSAFINLNYCLSHLMMAVSIYHNDTGLSNYDVLVQKAYEYSVTNDADVMFVTFNYDILLEHSLSKVYYGQTRQLEIHEYINKPLKIIKPHGSCNWFKKINGKSMLNHNETIPDHLYDTRTTLKKLTDSLDNNFRIIPSPINFEITEHVGPIKQFFFPQLLIPLKEKDDFILPKEHDEYLKQNLNEVDEILIVGWKGTENKFLELLQRNLGSKTLKITCVNAGYKGIETTLKPILPNAIINHYLARNTARRIDNTKLHGEVNERSSLLTHTPGSFSSYIMGLLQNNHQSIFENK